MRSEGKNQQCRLLYNSMNESPCPFQLTIASNFLPPKDMYVNQSLTFHLANAHHVWHRLHKTLFWKLSFGIYTWMGTTKIFPSFFAMRHQHLRMIRVLSTCVALAINIFCFFLFFIKTPVYVTMQPKLHTAFPAVIICPSSLLLFATCAKGRLVLI